MRARTKPLSLTSRSAPSPSPPCPASPHYPGGDHGQRFSSGGQRCGPWAPGPPRGKARAQGPLPARAAEPRGRCDPDWGCGPGTLPQTPAAHRDWTRPTPAPGSLPRLPPPASRFRASREGRGLRVKGRGRDETTIPSRSCAGAVQAAGRMGLLLSSPIVWGLSLTWRRCKTEVAE